MHVYSAARTAMESRQANAPMIAVVGAQVAIARLGDCGGVEGNLCSFFRSGEVVFGTMSSAGIALGMAWVKRDFFC